MARYAQGGGGGYAYHAEWMNPYADPNDLLGQSILNQNESALIHSFFSDPDGPMANGSYFNMSEDMPKPSGEFVGEAEGFDPSQIIHNPAMTVGGGSSNSTYYTHSTPGHPNFQTLASQPKLLSNMNRPEHFSDEDDVKAASGLMSMGNQDGSRATAAFGTSAGGSWGTFGSSNPMFPTQDQIRSPMSSSGRQSANSHHNMTHNQARANAQYFPNGQAPQYMWQQQQHHMTGFPRARHGSLQIETSHINFFPQTQMPQSAGHLPLQNQPINRPPAYRFGSDQDFRSGGYHARNGHRPVEFEKGANLNNVPFAAQAAADAQLHMQPFTPVDVPRVYPHYAGPPSTSALHSASTNSSPHRLGGLPLHPMAPNTYHRGPPWPKMAHQTTEDDDDVESDQDADFDESPPRKRRKSHLQREDESEYTPDHVKAPTTKRGAKAAKARGGDDGSDDEYEEITPAASRTASKRRKSSTNARPHLGSSQSASPANAASPTGKTAATGKKKGRGAQSRQNLTEDEKRRNHIQSEKTRRDLIKLQYDALDTLVPTLKNGKSGLSRSDVLREISTFVESVVEGNNQIESILGVSVDDQASDASDDGPG